jgi:ribonuclease R
LGVLGANKGRTKATNLELETPRDFSKLLEILKKSFSDEPSVFKAVQSSILRTLKQARYSNERLGHFALALRDYTHFTSPIRRYPDLVAHRLMKEALGSLAPQASLQDMESVARHCSDQERVAMDTERKLIETKKCRFMEPKIGEEFDAWVSGVTEKGCFVTLSAHAVDGLMNNVMLQRVGRYRHRPETLSYQGPGARSLQMGSSVRVRLTDVNVETRKIDFELLE